MGFCMATSGQYIALEKGRKSGNNVQLRGILKTPKTPGEKAHQERQQKIMAEAQRLDAVRDPKARRPWFLQMRMKKRKKRAGL